MKQLAFAVSSLSLAAFRAGAVRQGLRFTRKPSKVMTWRSVPCRTWS
ncbi:hypothetical protein PE066_05035 [Ramlibacter tataouinensis]|nr:hypothetical protein [Ramlibacter tataouinensis]WBY02905.1 hypothetical protein PE066_05035 [Ramlibacter tataouinensis]